MKSKFIHSMNGIFMSSIVVCGTIPFLTSCSTTIPTFTVTNATQDGVKNETIGVDAIWKGYYFDDVALPWETTDGIIIPPEHKKDIEIDLDRSSKTKDEIHKTQSANVYFNIRTTPQKDEQSGDVKIAGTIRHTNFKKISTITINPPKNNIININKEFIYNSKPNIEKDKDPTVFPNNSIECINGIYNSEGRSSNSRGDIETHLTNDLIGYQYLIYKTLQYVYIDDSTNTYASLDSSTGKLHVELVYNYQNQIFDYIRLNASATGKVYAMGVIPFDGNISLNYNGGQPADEKNDIKAVPGPKLMGAYTVDGTDYNTHFPQGYNPKIGSKYEPYTQDFLALVPSSLESYQTYNITISSKVFSATSGQHVYFLSQPRFLGLEYTNGQLHIILRSATSREDGDSFRNGQLTIPSYTLSGTSYDFDKSEGISKYPQKQIEECYVDMSNTQLFTNQLPNHNTEQGAKSFMFNHDFTDVNLNNDPNFIQTKIKEYQCQNNCLVKDSTTRVAPGEQLNIYRRKGTSEEPLLKNVPYYQVIQQASPSGYTPSRTNGGNLATYHSDSSADECNIKLSDDKKQFTLFAMGLNYMFYTNNMQVNSDHVFCYDENQLLKINQTFGK